MAKSKKKAGPGGRGEKTKFKKATDGGGNNTHSPTIREAEGESLHRQWIAKAQQQLTDSLGRSDNYCPNPYVEHGMRLELLVPNNIRPYLSADGTPLMLTGKLIRKDQSFFFKHGIRPDISYEVDLLLDEGICIPTGLDSLLLELADYNKPVEPLYSYLASKSIEITIIGKPISGCDRLHVSDIFLGTVEEQPGSSVSYSKCGTPQDLVKAIVCRLTAPELGEFPVGPGNKRYTSVEDMELLYHFFKDEYPPEIKRMADDAFKQLKTSSASDEKKHSRKTLEYLLNICWRPARTSALPIDLVKWLLDREVYGLESVKRQILRIVAQVNHTGKLPVLGVLFCGPPGNAKTTLALLLFKILHLFLLELDMNTLDDPATINGSYVIYSNAKPGKFAHGLYNAQTSQIGLLAEELDKVIKALTGSSAADALLTILEKRGFRDNFFSEAIPTSNVFCIATCNDASLLSKPLLDRFLRIDVPAYTDAEKYEILSKYVLPKQLDRNDVAPEDFSLDDEALRLICGSYSIEPGARQLTPCVETLISEYLLRLDENGPKSVRYGPADVAEALGPPKRVKNRFVARPGIVQSAVMLDGAVRIVPVEAAVRDGVGKLAIENAAESVQSYCRVAYVRALEDAGLAPYGTDVFIFFPEYVSASAGNTIGIAVYAAILSAVTGVTVPEDTLFVGGCDPVGNTYHGGIDLNQVLKNCAEKNIDTFFVPLGSVGQISFKGSARIIEAQDVDTLVSMAIPG